MTNVHLSPNLLCVTVRVRDTAMTSSPDVSDLMTMVEGLPRPEWEAIADRIEGDVGPDDRRAAWTCALRQWMDRLCLVLANDTKSMFPEYGESARSWVP